MESLERDTRRNSANGNFRWIRLILGIFVLLSCLRAWVSPGPFLPVAEAQIPDAGLQRKQILDAIERTNALLGEFRHDLQNGTLNVRMVGTDNKADAAAPNGSGQ
ncbi:MAG: hypothetical protein HY287_10340 [Planctomycetes bacterium]|nr:hypothetical protein [Planctomycetota bacterium]MBI3834715.1 hypothetical protein [Planctomycetota bacterium]